MIYKIFENDKRTCYLNEKLKKLYLLENKIIINKYNVVTLLKTKKISLYYEFASKYYFLIYDSKIIFYRGIDDNKHFIIEKNKLKFQFNLEYYNESNIRYYGFKENINVITFTDNAIKTNSNTTLTIEEVERIFKKFKNNLNSTIVKTKTNDFIHLFSNWGLRSTEKEYIFTNKTIKKKNILIGNTKDYDEIECFYSKYIISKNKFYRIINDQTILYERKINKYIVKILKNDTNWASTASEIRILSEAKEKCYDETLFFKGPRNYYFIDLYTKKVTKYDLFKDYDSKVEFEDKIRKQLTKTEFIKIFKQCQLKSKIKIKGA